MLQLSQCKIHYKKNTRSHLIKKVARALHIKPEEISNLKICKRNIDARKKPEIYYSYTVSFEVKNEQLVLQKNKGNRNLVVYRGEPDLQKQITAAPQREKIIVVGAGPAGLFAAYYLSLCGQKPLVVERGAEMEERIEEVEKFWKEMTLEPESNVSFGEGGAGTFSDGKLNTGVKDKTGKKRFVLESFVRFGAGEDILYDTNPHIGTDVLRKVIINMRKEMEQLGCRFLFRTKVTGLLTDETCILHGVQVSRGNKTETMACDRLILAIGHSARDTFDMLCENGVEMSPKAFAVGVRVQHNQDDINRMQYGIADNELPPAPYKCTGKTKDGRGVYSFCMCPGGYVVNASTEKGGLVVNGMSNVARDSGAANSAIVVTIEPEDFEGDNPLAGVRFQRKWEQKVYGLLQGKIPVQRYGDFKNDVLTTSCGCVKPCVKGQWGYANLRKALPKFVINGMIDGMECFDKKLSGFADDDALLMGFEARTSSPVRIERGTDFVSKSHDGLYPCGEGAGYAGGIMSAAMDGLRVAMAIQEKWRKEE
ncbi:MAG: FAD-dependent oxidoreductase [Eubacterium sp.]|nr:FAD-dependent oxidoreductase [Eubacterium sp.]